ncbi:MAG TPA: hypothetical protein VGF98_09080 [Candidatus Tumulicola sp.]
MQKPALFLSVIVALFYLFGQTAVARPAPSPAPTSTPLVRVTSGDLISVQLIGGDIGSRISNENDTFAVITSEDYYFRGNLVLPKGSPGYGVITHLKRAGMWHSGGELSFTVKRLVAPDGSTLDVETNGATADADKNSEKNGNEVGQYLLFGLAGVFTHRGNDILIKDGTMFHVAVSSTTEIPSITYGTRPAAINWNLVTVRSASQTDIQSSGAQAVPSPSPSPGLPRQRTR